MLNVWHIVQSQLAINPLQIFIFSFPLGPDQCVCTIKTSETINARLNSA